MLQDVLSIEAMQRHRLLSVAKTLRPTRRRQLVVEVRVSWMASIRRACSALKVVGSLYTCKFRRGDQADLKIRIQQTTRTRYDTDISWPAGDCGQSPRGVVSTCSHDGRVGCDPEADLPLYKEMKLQLRNSVPKRCGKAKLRDDWIVATHVNQTWATRLHPRPTRNGPQAAHPHNRRRVLAHLAGVRREFSAIEAKTWCGHWSASAARLATPRPSGSTRDRNLSHEITTFEPARRTSSSTSRGLASRPTMPSSSPSTVSSQPNA